MVLGDSFMYGAGSPLDENVPSLLESKLGGRYDVFNLSVTGWGLDQMYLAYQKYKDIIRPYIVILAFIDDDDVVRVLEAHRIYEGANKPSFDIERGQLVLRVTCDRSWKDTIASHSIFLSLLNRELSIIWTARPIAALILDLMAEETTRRRERLIVLRIPQVASRDKTRPLDSLPYMIHIRTGLWRAISAARSLQWSFEQHDVLYLEPLEEMKLQPGWPDHFYLPDGHFLRKGNLFIADYLARTISQSSAARK